ncbi:MAG TPA: hypothetical protein VK272_01265 [Solirubrobacteraceae bacterium]|nr:hypothetical protein [Solirubrobacteraceae bacterium]
MTESFTTSSLRDRVRNTAMLLATTATLAAVGAAATPAWGAAAHDARTLAGNAAAHLHLVKAEGSQLIEEGSVAGVLIGSVRAQLHTGALFTASFTIRTRDGAITGRGQATPHGSGRYQSFAGSFTATGGSGRYAHIRGRAGLYGVFDRRSESVLIQTSGTLTY